MLIFGDGLRVYLQEGDNAPLTIGIPGRNGEPITSLGALVSAAFAADGTSLLFATNEKRPGDLEIMARLDLSDYVATPVRFQSETGTAFDRAVLAASPDSTEFYVAGLTTALPGERRSALAVSNDEADSWSTLVFQDELEVGDGSVNGIHSAPRGALIMRTRQRVLLRTRHGVLQPHLSGVNTLMSSDAMCDDAACTLAVSTIGLRVGIGVVKLSGESASTWSWFDVSPFNPLICRWLREGEVLLGGVNTEEWFDAALLVSLNTNNGEIRARSAGLPSVQIVIESCDIVAMSTRLRGLAVGNGKVFANMFLGYLGE